MDRKSFGSGVRAAVLGCGLAIAPMIAFAQGQAHSSSQVQTATPIKHLIVVFQENVSFDHYFATYPNAQPNLDGSVYFQGGKPGTPTVNGLTPALLTHAEFDAAISPGSQPGSEV
jgi:phospholipase C